GEVSESEREPGPSTHCRIKEQPKQRLRILGPRFRGDDSNRGSSTQIVSLARLLKVSQIRRRLVLPGRHQMAVGTEEIAVVADFDVLVVLDAHILARSEERRVGKEWRYVV